MLSKVFKKLRIFQGRLLVKLFGWSVFEEVEKFDIIFLLDSCRFDAFFKINFLPGILKKKVSLGSCTPEWAKNSLPEKPLKNLIYLSSNPFVSSYYLEKWGRREIFYKLYPLWDYGWNENLNTVHPSVVLKEFLSLLKKEPEKKFFVHFMQPHHPFIGKTRIKESGWKISRDIVKNRDGKKGVNIYELVEKGIVSKKEFKKAYEDNLRLVLGEIAKILPEIKNKKILITSDHGELLGEYGLFGHPENLPVPELIVVPYFILKK